MQTGGFFWDPLMVDELKCTGSGSAAVCHRGQRRRRMAGLQEDKGRGSRWSGRDGGGDVCQEVWLYIGANRRKKESLSGILHFSLPIYQSLPFPFPVFTPHLDSRCPFFFSFQHHFWIPHIAFSFSFLSRLLQYMSAHLSSFSFIPFTVLYLSLAPSFHFCLFVSVFTISSMLHLFTGKELGVRSVPVQCRLCHPTKRVGVKHRH